MQRYEQRRRLAKARTTSCSSSDASDDDNESRKKRVDKLKSLPRRDSHDDSSDPGPDGPHPGGPDGDGHGAALSTGKPPIPHNPVSLMVSVTDSHQIVPGSNPTLDKMFFHIKMMLMN